MMKKRLLTVLLSALLALSCMSFAACGEGGGGDYDGGELDPDTKVTISFMHMWPEHNAAIKSIIDAFTAKHPNITVNISVTPYDQIEQQLQAAYMGGTMPNVYVFYTHYMTPLVSASEGVMAGSFNSDIYDSIIGDFKQPDAWEMGKIDGKYYSVPFRATGELIFFNKTIFEQKGWEKPETFQELQTLMAAISADKQYTPLAASGKDAQITYFVNAMSLFTSISDGSTEEPGYKVGRLKPDEDSVEAVKIYEKVKSWYSADYFGKGAISASRVAAIKEFTSRNAAMVFANVNSVGDISTLLPNDEIEAFAIPAPEAIADTVKYVFGGYDGLSYSPTGTDDQKAASVMLIKYLVSQEAQQAMIDKTQSVVVNKNAVYRDTAYAAFAEELKYVGAYATGTDYVTGTHSAGNNSLISAYIAGTDSRNAKTIIDIINANVLRDMQDSLINDPVVDWIERTKPKLPYDSSWLN